MNSVRTSVCIQRTTLNKLHKLDELMGKSKNMDECLMCMIEYVAEKEGLHLEIQQDSKVTDDMQTPTLD